MAARIWNHVVERLIDPVQEGEENVVPDQAIFARVAKIELPLPRPDTEIEIAAAVRLSRGRAIVIVSNDATFKLNIRNADAAGVDDFAAKMRCEPAQWKIRTNGVASDEGNLM